MHKRAIGGTTDNFHFSDQEGLDYLIRKNLGVILSKIMIPGFVVSEVPIDLFEFLAEG
jgi:methyl coenzyme M reductase subunit C